MNTTIKAHAQMLGFTVLLGGSFIASANISNTLDPMVITWLRYLIASIVFLMLFVVKGALTMPSLKDIGRYTLISLPPLLYFICMIFALRTTSAVDSSALYTTVPLMSMVFGWVLFRFRSSWFILMALVLGILGALLIIFKGDLIKVLQLQFTASNLLFLFGCIGMALNPIVVKVLHRGEQALVMTGWSLICATLILTILVSRQLPSIALFDISVVTWQGVFYLAFFATALSFFLFQKACLVLSPTKISGYVYLIPISVICTDALLGKTQSWAEISLGIMLVLVSIVLLIRLKS